MQRFIVVIVSVLLFLGIFWGTTYFYSLGKKHDLREVPFFTPNFEVIAHRGGSLEAPENTLVAFDYATTLSPNVILEMDVHLTSDQQLVVFHDPVLNRTTNGIGPLKEKTLAELRQLDAAYNFQNSGGEFSWRGHNVQIPTLEEVLQKYPNTKMIIEVKPQSIDAAVATYEMIAKYNRLPLTLIGSEHTPIIRYIKEKDPSIFTTAGKDEILRSVMLENVFLEKLDPMKADAFCIPEKHDGIKVLTPRFLAELKLRNKKAFIWTVNEESDMIRLKNLGVDGIITDRPQALLTLSK